MRRRKIMAILSAGLFMFPTMLSATPSEDGGITLDEIVCGATYYGTEASTHPNNPCKGATTRKCAELRVHVIRDDSESCTLIQLLNNEVGEFLGETRSKVKGTPEDVIDAIKYNLPPNADFEIIQR